MKSQAMMKMMVMKMMVVMMMMEGAAAQQRGLFPAILNLASNAVISSNATCGDPEAEVYCKLVEHVPGRIVKNPHCPRCDANSLLAKERHPITNAIDGTNQWWQSPSIKNGHQFHWITITLDLKQIFQVAYIIIKAANSPRPGNWILERSVDGVTFDPWQFYALSDSECLSRYQMAPRLGPPTYRSDTEVICTSYYSRLNPLEHGEIHTSLINGRPGADDLTSDLLSFTSARFIRLRLQRIRTLNADLMTLSAHDPRDIDPIVSRRYYYSIKDVSVGGMCICFGHAKSCPLDTLTKRLKCVCEHNTCGENCDRCCPGFNQELWQPGTVSEGNTCQKCNCHNKALDCVFNQTVWDLSLSLNQAGLLKGGGVCLNCQQDTAGVNCQSCRDGYYRPQGVSPYSDSPCVLCSCDPRGSESSVCVHDDSQPGVSAGQCVCREGFSGRQCDRCAFGFRSFPRCERCLCDLTGSTNTDPCGTPCTCKPNVMGAHCDLCKPGFFHLDGSDPLGCTDCFCFGVSDVCESSGWATAQVFESEAWLRPSPLLEAPPSFQTNELVLPGNASSGRAPEHMMSWAAPAAFLGNQLVSYGGFLNVSVSYDVPLDNEDRSVPAHCDIIIQGNGQRLRLAPPSSLVLSPLAESSVSVAMEPRSFVSERSGGAVTRDDLLTALASVTALTVRLSLGAAAAGPVSLTSVSLDRADPRSRSAAPAVAVETCECPYGYSGTSCETCLPGFYRVGGVLFGGNCLQCECHDHASACDINGLCLGCTHNTSGPHCEQCLPGFHGDATEGTDSDCGLCPCPLTLPSNSFSPTCVLESSGQVSCDQCQEGYTGSNCERCANGYFGNPQVVGGACERCRCHGNVDVTEPGHCDALTGECLRCRGNTGGGHCDRCLQGYYGDAQGPQGCSECACDPSGAVSSVCDLSTGQCSCREHVEGRACQRCQVGFFGLQGGAGCLSCNCSRSTSLSESCDSDGRCVCVEGVGGAKCDVCSRGYHGYSANGCTACTCEHTGGNCDPEGGACICPPHTQGDTCHRCEDGHWGHDIITGCKPCSCSEAGSSAPQCDVISGQCPCRGGFSGRSCDLCAPGHHRYPECSACGCDPAGTEEQSCSRGVCDCAESGQCVCKVGVSGRRCEECVSGRFGLSDLNQDGCSECFCSGLSSDCEERGGLTHTQIALSPPPLLPLVTQWNLQGSVAGVHLQDGAVMMDTRQLNTTQGGGGAGAGALYWRLTEQFQGNQLMSYGGLLSYVITFYAEDGEGLTNQEPQVVMRGGALRKLVIYSDAPAPTNGVAAPLHVRMTEHNWKYFNSVSERSVSRADLMSVLSDLQYVIIKASYGTRLQQSRISNITMETAVEAKSEGSEVRGGVARGGVARLIESCSCPVGYTGLSCQECATGYFRQPLSELSPQSRKSLFVRPCVACRCSNHSQLCDTHTGDCQECGDHTSGRSCELCAPGYHGNVRGDISDCSLCACPLKDNSFSPTCASEGGAGDFRCTSCQTGYEGRYCERCSVGYHGNPSSPGGRCSACSCSRWGSLHLSCDIITGQCTCNPGVRGRSCDQCDHRHVLQGGECVSCDDECSGLLLDDLDHLERRLLSVNVSGAAPWRRLAALQNRTRDAQVMSSERRSLGGHLTRARDEAAHLTSDLEALERRAAHLRDGARQVGAAADGSVSQGALLLRRIGGLTDGVRELLREAELLNRTEEEEELDPTNHTLLLRQTELMLEALRGVDQSGAGAAAERELGLARALSASLQDHFLSGRKQTERRLRLLADDLTVAVETLNDTHTHLEGAEQRNTHTHSLLNNTHNLLEQYQSARQLLIDSCASVGGASEQSQLLLADSLGLVEEFTNTSTQVEVLGSELQRWRPLLRRQVDALVLGLRTTDALEQVYKAEGHAHLMMGHAHHLHSSLMSVRNVSQNGTRLAELDDDITAQVGSAQLAASLALRSALLALNMSDQSEEPLWEQISANHNVSAEMIQEVQQVDLSLDDLRSSVSMATSRLSLCRESVRNSSRLLRRPITELQSFSDDWSRVNSSQQAALAGAGAASSLQAALAGAGAASSLQAALQRLQSVSAQLQASAATLEDTAGAAALTNQLVGESQRAANEAQRKLEEAELRTDHLLERVKPLSILGETLGRNLSDIRELIKQARRQAASIKVAVAADRDCVRSYKPQIDSSNFNTLSLILKTTSAQNLLFYLGSATTVDFLAVEMHDGRVSVLWDLGSGSNRLETEPVHINNNRWTRVNVTRLGAQVSLSVHQLESESAPSLTVTGRSPGSSRVLDLDQNSLIHIGGLGANTQSPAALRSTTFQGCLGEAVLNERNIGLWNYERREGACGGCFSSPQAEETSFHFDGSGFSLVEKSLRSTSTSVVFQFKTLSPSGLLLYLASNNTRDFLSLELVEGRVRLTFDLGSGALILTSNRKYNTGAWYKITLQRNKRKGYLSIMAADQSSEKEVLEAESPGAASDLNRSDLDPIYIGGLPASRPIRRQVVSRSYVGCIKNVEIARSNFDLLREALGVRKGCVLEAVRSVSVLSGGFVQVAPPTFGPEAELLFSFSSKNQSGVLLTTFSRDHAHKQHFLSVHLVSGHLGVELGEVGGASQSVSIIKAQGSFGDGDKHSVIVSINRKSVSVQVDEGQVTPVPLLPGGFPRLSPASLFIGGLPSAEAARLPITFQDLSRAFRGCIQNLVLGGRLVDLSGALRYEGVVLDSCRLEEREGALLPDDPEVEPTQDPAHLSVATPTHLSALTPGAIMCATEAEPGLIPGAAHFGTSRHSHMTFIIRPGAVRRSVSLKLTVRTRAPEGLLLLLTDSKQMDFLVLKLSGGRVMMSSDLGRGSASVSSNTALNDGGWHTVSAELSRRSASVWVDGSSPSSVTLKGNQLDVDETLYLGGAGGGVSTRRINASSSFPGCIGSVSLNGAMLDLTKPASQHDVTSCFTKDQTGSYFNGSGYAVLMHDGYKVGSDMTVSLEFRTSQSDGVLLGISSAKVDAIGLELVNGQVVFNVNNGAGRVSARSVGGGAALCDGRWHRLVARKSKHSLSLQVDARRYTANNPYPQSTSAETNNPVYLGGFPVGVRQNSLSVSSGFRGCLRNVQLIKSHLIDSLHLSSAHFLSGVTPHSCPAL